MTKFEYLVETAEINKYTYDEDEDRSVTRYLDRRGDEGWELVEFKRTKDNRFRMIFKREATE